MLKRRSTKTGENHVPIEQLRAQIVPWSRFTKRFLHNWQEVSTTTKSPLLRLIASLSLTIYPSTLVSNNEAGLRITKVPRLVPIIGAGLLTVSMVAAAWVTGASALGIALSLFPASIAAQYAANEFDTRANLSKVNELGHEPQFNIQGFVRYRKGRPGAGEALFRDLAETLRQDPRFSDASFTLKAQGAEPKLIALYERQGATHLGDGYFVFDTSNEPNLPITKTPSQPVDSSPKRQPKLKLATPPTTTNHNFLGAPKPRVPRLKVANNVSLPGAAATKSIRKLSC